LLCYHKLAATHRFGNPQLCEIRNRIDLEKIRLLEFSLAEESNSIQTIQVRDLEQQLISAGSGRQNLPSITSPGWRCALRVSPVPPNPPESPHEHFFPFFLCLFSQDNASIN
jgi:hypothetical protein